jgi:hypothetical protein
MNLLKSGADFSPARRIRVRCCSCGEMSVHPVAEHLLDWRKEAEFYKEKLYQVIADVEQMGQDIEAMTGENPIQRYLNNRLFVAIDDKLREFDSNLDKAQ